MRKCLYLNIDVLIEGDDLSPSVIQDFCGNFDYNFVSNTEGIKIINTEIVNVEDGGE